MGTFMSKHCSPISYGTPLEKKSCSAANYGSPLNQKMEPGNVGYYDPEFEEHPSMKLPTRPENQAEIKAAKFSKDIAEKKFKDLRNLFTQSEVVGDKDPVLSKQILRERESLGKEIYGLRKQSADANAKMRKQKRKDYKTILKAGETIGKSLKR